MRFAWLFSLSSVLLLGQGVRTESVPFVGCPSDGQLGPQDAPTGESVSLKISRRDAGRLAYYKSAQGVAVLAPRGWRCFGVYGSGGDALFVAPERFGAKELLSPKQFKFDGAVVTALRVFGGTSGRFRVAEVIFRVFPTHRDFAEQVAKELEPPNRFEEGPYPSDILTYRGKEMVEFKTPRESDGLGTFNSLVANNQAIEGAAMLVGPDTDLLMTSVRLPRGLGSLAPVIIRRFESDAPSF